MHQDPEHPSGVASDGESETSGGLVRARERKANAALQLRSKGAEWEDIAQVVGYPTGRAALIAVEGALERNLQDQESKEQMRAMVRTGLNSILRTTMTKATNVNHEEQLAAAGKARDIYAQISKLYGLDAPAEVVVTSPADAELEAWVERVAAAEHPQVVEADIFDIVDGEVVSDAVELP